MRDELATIPGHMADAVRALLPDVTIARYQRFLDHMYHYTRGSEARLLHAAEHAPEHVPEHGAGHAAGHVVGHALDRRAYFAALAADERGHYRLAEADLAAFGRGVSAGAPSAVTAFD